MNARSTAHQAGRRSSIRTVIVRISRKLRATYRVRRGRLLSKLLAALLGAFAAQAFALPQGGVVQSGTVTINTPNANSMVLNQGTQKAVIDWQSFSIGAGQSVQFVQPGASSVALNRVVGGDVSSIFGTLSANGQVFLVNPAGVLFAPGAQVNVGGLVASTLNLSNADFLAGRYTFSGDSGASVVNNGMIRAGYVALAGAQVANAGTIEAAQGGSVGLLAGSRVTVDPAGAGLVKFSVDSAAVNAAASNSGTIVAEGGQVLMAAQAVGDTLATVVNQSGVIRANTVAEQGGVITLSGGTHGVVKVSGTIEAKGDDAGEKGGTVKVLGDRVGLMAGANVDASGDAGGGTVLVGGNFQGKGPEQNANRTYVDQNASIKADAGTLGDGGKVIVWADEVTRYHGSISAKGGANGGAGGFAEVSGKQSLDFTGDADLSAANGTMGTLLLDPTDINIVNGGGDTTKNYGPGDEALAFSDAPATANIDASTLAALNAAITLQATNDITISEAVALANQNFVAMAGRSVNVNANISTGTGVIALTAASWASGPADPLGKVTVGAGTTLTGQHVSLLNDWNATANVVNGNIAAASSVNLFSSANLNGSVNGASLNVYSGTATLGSSNRIGDTTAVNIDSGATLAMGGFSDTVGAVTLTNGTISNGTLTGASYDVQNGTVSASLAGTGALFKTGGGTVTLSGANTYGGGTNVMSGTLRLAHNSAAGGGGIGMLSNQTVEIHNAVIANSVTLQNGGVLRGIGTAGLSGPLTLWSGTGQVDAGAGNTLTVSGVVGGSGALQKTGAGMLVLSGANTYTGATNVNGGTLWLQGGGTLASTIVNVNSGTLSLGGNERLANTAAVTVNNGAVLATSFDETIGSLAVNGGTLNAAGTITAASYALNGGTVNTNLGTGTINSNGTVALNGTAAAGTVNVQTGTLTLGNTANRLTGASPVIGIAAGATLDTGTASQDLGSGGTAVVSNAGTFKTGGAVKATSITGAGSASIGGNVTTTGGQQAYGSVSLANDAQLQDMGGGMIGLGSSVTGNGKNLTIVTTGGATSTGAIGGIATLTTNAGTGLLKATDIAADKASFGGNVQATAGNIAIATETTFTTDSSLTATGTIGLGIANSSGGVRDVTTSATTTTIARTGTNLGALDVTGDLTTAGQIVTTGVKVTGAATLGGNVYSSAGNQDYQGTVSIAGANVTLGAFGNNIAFASTVSGSGTQNLTIENSGTLGLGTGISGLNNLTISNANASVNLPTTTVNGALTVNANAVGQSGVVTASKVGGSATGAFDLGTQSNVIASLGVITAGSISVNDGAGGLNITGALSSSGDMTIATAGDLTVSAGITGTGLAGKTLTLKAGNNVVFDSSADVGTANALNVVLNSDSDASGLGAIALGSGTTVNSKGGNIALGGGLAPATGAARGAAAQAGINLTGATLNAGGGAISMRGQAGTSRAGIEVFASSLVLASGDITMVGDGGIGSGSIGIKVDSSSIETGGAGSISMTGSSVNGSGGQTDRQGVKLENATIRANGSGNMVITGTSNEDAASAIWMWGSTLGGASATGDILLHATGGTSPDIYWRAGTTAQTAGNVTLNAGAGSSQVDGSITAAGLRVLGMGAFNLNGTNDVATLASNLAPGSLLSYSGANAFSVGTVTSFDGAGSSATAGLVGGGIYALSTTGAVTVDNAIDAGAVSINADAGITLGANVKSTSIQVYQDAVTIVDARNLTGTTVTFNGTVGGNGAGGADDLTVTGDAAINGTVGGTALNSLNVTGTTALGANVSTTTSQTYGGAVSVTGARNLTGSLITFNGALGGDGAIGNDDLTVTGNAAVNGAVGGTALNSLAVTGTTALAANVTTTGNQSYGAAVTLAGDTVVDAGTGGITFASTIAGQSGTESLTTRNTGALTLGGPIGNLANLTIAGGPTAVNLPTTQLTGTLDVTTAGSLLQSGALTADTVRVSAGGDVTLTNAGNMLIKLGPVSAGGFNGVSVRNASAGGLAVAGPVSAAAGPVDLRTTGQLLIQDAVTSTSTITADAEGAIVQTGAGRFATSGLLNTRSGGAQTLGGANAVGSFVANMTGPTGDISLTNTAADLHGLVMVPLSGNVSISNTGNLTMVGPTSVSVGGNGNVALSSSGALAIDGAINVMGSGSVVLNAGTDIVIRGPITATNGSVSANFGQAGTGGTFSAQSSMNVGPPGQLVTITGGSGNDTFDLSSAGPIIGATANLAGGGGSDTLKGRDAGTTYTVSGVDSGSTADGVAFKGIGNLIGGTGSDTFAIGAGGSLSGTVTGGAGADTLDVSALATTVDAAAGIVAGAVLGGGFTGIEAIAGSADTSLVGSAFHLTGVNSGTVDGLNYSGVGNLVGVGATTAFTGSGGSIQGHIIGTAASTILSGTLTSGGTQTYTGAVTLAANTTLAGTMITADAIAAGAHSLTLAGPATTGAITGTGALVANGDLAATRIDVGSATLNGNTTSTDTLTTAGNLASAAGKTITANDVSVGGTASLGGNVTTTAGQTYAGATTLGGNVTLAGTSLTAGAIATGANSLTLAGPATTGDITGTGALVANGDLTATRIDVGSATLNGSTTSTGTLATTGNLALAVGKTITAGDVSVGGTASVGGNVTTSVGGQAYGGMALTGNAVLSDTANSALTLGNVAGGANSLTLASTGGVTAGTMSNLAALTTTNGTGLAAGSISTGTLDLRGTTTVTNAVVATGQLTQGNGVTLNADSVSAGNAYLGGSVTTIGAQNYGASTDLAGAVSLTGSSVALGTVTGNGNQLTVSGPATAGAIGSVGALTTHHLTAASVGAASLNTTGNVNVGGAVNVAGAVAVSGMLNVGGTLGAASVAAGSANLGDNATVAGALATTGDLALATGKSITADSVSVGGATSLGGNVTTAGAQTYTGVATLTGAATLTSTGNAGITFATGLLGGGNDLAIASGGTTSIANATGIGTFTAGTNGTTSGAITAAVYNLNGGTVDAGLGGGTLNQVSGTTVLNGTTSAGAVNIDGGTLRLGSTDRLADGATVTVGAAGTLDLGGFTDTVATANLAGTLAGAGKLTAATYNLNGGTVNASLGTGTLNQVGGTSTLNGTSGASTVNVNGGTLQLGNAANRLAGATTVAIGAGSTLDTGAAAQLLGAVTNNGTLTTGGAIQAASIASAGTAAFGANVKTTGAQSYTGALSTAAGSTLEAGGNLTAGNASIGEGTTLRLNGAGAIDVAGNYAGAVKVDGGATRVTLTDASAATPFVVNQMVVAPTAAVTLNSAGALTIDAANLAPLASLDVNVAKGDLTFLNTSTLRNGQPGVLATGGIALQVDEGSLNTQADPMWINVATPNMSVTISGDHKAWLSGNVSSDAVIRRILSSAQDGVGASRAEMVREFLHELKRNVGVGAVEDLVLSGGIDMEGITAPLNFSNLAVRLPRCANEQANQQPCN